MKAIKTSRAPEALGPYSQAISANGFLFISGQIPINPSSGNIEASTIEGQTLRVLNNIKAIITAEGIDMNKVVKTTLMLTDLTEFDKVNKIYSDFFTEPFPARTTFEVNNLPKNAKIAIDVIVLSG